jgi:hypothetical protein
MPDAFADATAALAAALSGACGLAVTYRRGDPQRGDRHA